MVGLFDEIVEQVARSLSKQKKSKFEERTRQGLTTIHLQIRL